MKGKIKEMKTTSLILGFLLNSLIVSGQEINSCSGVIDTISNLSIVIKDTLGYDSLVQVYYSNGQLFYQIPYRKGLQNGWCEQYHRNGFVLGKDLRIDGKTVDGYNVYFLEDGSIYQKGEYKNGYLFGKWYGFAPSGRPQHLYFYNKKGELVKKKRWDNGKKKWVKCGI